MRRGERRGRSWYAKRGDLGNREGRIVGDRELSIRSFEREVWVPDEGDRA